MGVWIRSQGGHTVMRCDMIAVHTVTERVMGRGVTYLRVCIIVDGVYNVATYPDEETAVRVLDEIVRRMELPKATTYSTKHRSSTVLEIGENVIDLREVEKAVLGEGNVHDD